MTDLGPISVERALQLYAALLSPAAGAVAFSNVSAPGMGGDDLGEDFDADFDVSSFDPVAFDDASFD